MDHDHQERIRQRAHEIWESEGRPEGRDAEHWNRAEEELKNRTGDDQPAGDAESQPARAARSGRSAKAPGTGRKTKASSPSDEPAKPKRTRKTAKASDETAEPQAESTPYLNDGP
ncbi:DUF2934 domain-containing protein [Paracoccus angustae]|uniref:DUF2934 domain-containing protein n=1 Tax=Paracoccus angustae TaxID=1671480 RepID=A0ABV7U6H2_9RHOB